MDLILQRGLAHQIKPVEAIVNALQGVNIELPKQYFENPGIDFSGLDVQANIKEIQKGLPFEYRNSSLKENKTEIDIKMETGTGKTYVYTNLIFELHKQFGLNKFIIAVPSLAIKAGTEQFIKDEYTRRHFRDTCGYGSEIEIGVIESPKNKKKGRSYFPSAISEYVKGSSQNTNKIQVLLVNMQLLTNGKLLTRDDYDYGVEGFYRPFDAIKATHPVVIIDEPHRFSRDQKAFSIIKKEIKPQCVIRFGATFPDVSSGRGKTKIVTKDYNNLLYNLNACDSFNQNLIKGVIKEHLEPVSKSKEKVKILAIKSNDSVTFQYKRKDERNKHNKTGIISSTIELKTGDTLSLISESFEGLAIDGIGKNTVEFSNGLVKSVGEELDVDIYMTSYQEQMMRLALQRHFEVEKINFCDRKNKIKTLALFFIDDISSYRNIDHDKQTYLFNAFERLLKERLEHEISETNEYENEYRNYLEASMRDISACHEGYFSIDNSDAEDAVEQKINMILRGKKQLISLKNQDGSYNTLRFLFSKWTLKEGWDNPNVFTIAKLRSSGSENSKLQEVGRGLRLPVDENGNRISNEEFQLNYIVDFTEADFAQRLIDEINGELPKNATIISEKELEIAAVKLGLDADELFDALYEKHYIDRKMNLNVETRDTFFEEYPVFSTGTLKVGKVTDANKKKKSSIKIRKAVYNEIKDLWETINQRYLLFYDKDINTNMVETVFSLLDSGKVFSDVVMTSTRESIKNDGSEMTVVSKSGVQYIITKPISYNEFLKRIVRATNIPIVVVHEAMSIYYNKHGNLDPNSINENSVSMFIQQFQEWKNDNLQGRFHYKRSSTPVKSTSLTYSDGSPREEIAQGRIGIKIDEGTPSEKYLYDVITYDSQLEKMNIKSEIEEVVVYGKIPRNSIAIPTITGGMYSPDFMYVVRKTTGEKELNIIVETKDVENRSELRGTEEIKIQCARKFFEILAKDGYKVVFRDQLNNKQMVQIIKEVLI